MGETKTTVMGFEGIAYYGAAGSTASNQITNRRDINYKTTPDKGDTTVAGDGTAPPVKTSRVTAIGVSLDITMLDKTNDPILDAFKVAATSGTPIAMRLKSHKTGKGFDGDVILDMEEGAPMNGEKTVKFTCEPTDEGGRQPKLLV
jgi:hypothetical protein